MDLVVPWQPLLNLIEPVYPKASSKGDRSPYPLATMLRIYLMQHWYSRSDPVMEDALIEVASIRSFAVIDMIGDRIHDETTILAFRHLLEKQDTMIDINLISTPSYTKNKTSGRDPEIHQTMKGNQWQYGTEAQAREAVSAYRC